MKQLQDLFPENLFWKSQTNSLGNIRYVSSEEARALYDAMATHYAENGVSDEPHETGDYMAGSPIVSDQATVFDELIEFFEKEIGFTSTPEINTAITTRKQERVERNKEVEAKRRADALAAFQNIGTLKRPTDPAIIEKLTGKLAEYKKRLERWNMQHPSARFQINPGFRDATYKIAVLEAVLTTSSEVNLFELMKAPLEQYGEHFCPEEFYFACANISIRLGTPIHGARFEESALT